MGKPDINLFWASGSPPCWRVMITLKEKCLEYKEKLLSFSEKQHKSPEVLAINPRGQLPTMTIDGNPLNESLAACNYLESEHSDQGTKLIPSEKSQKALVLQRTYEALTWHKLGADDLVFYLFRTKPEDRDKEDLKTRKDNFVTEVGRWDGYLKQQGPGSYIAGKSFTMADVVFYPSLAFFVRVGLELNPRFPSLASYYGMVSARPSVQATWPPHWKNSERGTTLKDL